MFNIFLNIKKKLKYEKTLILFLADAILVFAYLNRKNTYNQRNKHASIFLDEDRKKSKLIYKHTELILLSLIAFFKNYFMFLALISIDSSTILMMTDGSIFFYAIFSRFLFKKRL